MLPYVTDPRRARLHGTAAVECAERYPRDRSRTRQFTAMLARQSRHVHALRGRSEQGEFTLIRARQGRRGERWRRRRRRRLPPALPRDASFDGIVLSRLPNGADRARNRDLTREGPDPPAAGDGASAEARERLPLSHTRTGSRFACCSAGRTSTCTTWPSAARFRLGSRHWLLKPEHGHGRSWESCTRTTPCCQAAVAGLEVKSFWAAPEVRFPRTTCLPTRHPFARPGQPDFRQGDGRRVDL